MWGIETRELFILFPISDNEFFPHRYSCVRSVEVAMKFHKITIAFKVAAPIIT